MPSLVTDAIVLHAFDYLETSRIVRLMTRDAGVQSVIARGARSSRRRFGGGLDLFGQGTAEIVLRTSSELHTLASFDVARSRPQFAHDVGRFTAGSMIAELILRTASDEPATGLFDAIEVSLDRIAAAPSSNTIDAALAGAWSIVAALGFTPALDHCANCHGEIGEGDRAAFSHSSGGALCRRCGAAAAGLRVLPPEARSAIRQWVEGGAVAPLAPDEARAHQRLFREFFREHVGLEKELRAYGVWEAGKWSAA
jgi:DNA repair protein RecO (recombination protein O)